MTKSLTEKAEKRDLYGYYYADVHQYEGECEEDRFTDIVHCDKYGVDYESCYDGWDSIIEEVPSYDEFQRLKWIEKGYEKLQEQLKEANEVIKKYARGTFKMRCRKYEGTAVGTDIITGELVSEDLYGGYYYSDIPMSNKTDVAKRYLKKWGVK